MVRAPEEGGRETDRRARLSPSHVCRIIFAREIREVNFAGNRVMELKCSLGLRTILPDYRERLNRASAAQKSPDNSPKSARSAPRTCAMCLPAALKSARDIRNSRSKLKRDFAKSTRLIFRNYAAASTVK